MQRRHLIRTAVALPAIGMAAAAAATPDVTPASRITTRDGAQLFHRDWGKGKPILFVAGWSLSSEMWNYQTVPLVERGFRCIAFDRRGHGRSDEPGRGYDYDTLADDMATVIDRLDLRDVTLVAHSFGGGEAVRYLTRHGARRVKRLVLIAPSTPYLTKTADNPGGVDPKAFEHLRAVIARDYPKWMEDNEEPFVVSSTSRGTRAWLKGLMLQCSLPALLECNKIMTRTDFRPEVRAITVPTEVIHGDIDRSFPVELTGRPTTALIAGSRLTVVEGAPHAIFVTHADRLNADIERIANG